MLALSVVYLLRFEACRRMLALALIGPGVFSLDHLLRIALVKQRAARRLPGPR